jgi:hypothetical protein
MAIILKANKVNLIVSSVLFVFWYHSPNFLDTLRKSRHRHVAKQHAGPGKSKLPEQNIKANTEAELQQRAFLNSARDKDDWPASRPSHHISAKELRIRTQYEGLWAPKLVWTLWRNRKFSQITVSSSQ